MLRIKSEKNANLHQNFTICLFAVLSCFFMGSVYPEIKIGYDMFEIAANDIISQIEFAGLAFLFAGAISILAGSIMQKKILKPSAGNWKMIITLAGLETVLQYLFFYIGLAHASGVKSSILESTSVFFAILCSVFLFRFEKMTVSKAIGCLIGFSGVVIANLVGSAKMDASFSVPGEGFILLAAVVYAFSVCLTKLFSREEEPVTLVGYQFLIGGALLSVIGAAGGGRLIFNGGKELFLLILLAIGYAGGYCIWGVLMKHYPVAKVSVYGFMNPIFGVLLSAVVLGEKGEIFGPSGVLALFLICFGIYVVNKGDGSGKIEKEAVKHSISQVSMPK